MPRSIRHAANLIAVFTSLALAGCGGGGGSGGSSSGGGGGGNAGAGLTMTINTETVEFGAFGPSFGPPSRSLIYASVTGTASGTLYVIVTPSNPAVATVANIVLASNGGTADVIPGDPIALGIGNHTATITVKACVNDPTCTRNHVNGSPKTITVNYTVSGTMSDARSLTYTIGNSAVAGDFTRAFRVDQSPVSGWTATSDLPFLNITPTPGGTSLSTNVTASIDPATLDDYEGGTWSGNIRVTPNSVFAGLDLPVTVNITRTRVTYVAPYVAEAGRADQVIIRGENFDAAPPTGVRFGTVPATSFTVVSNTEIRATHPALQAGSHTVHVLNAQGVDRTRAVLEVVEPTAYPAVAIEYPDGPGVIAQELIYDAPRKALLISLVYNYSSDTNQLVRFAYGPGGWQYTGRIFIRYGSTFGLSNDGQHILLVRANDGYRGGALDELDPVTLATRRSLAMDGLGGGRNVVYANDGRAFIPTSSPVYSGSFGVLVYSSLRHAAYDLRPPGIPTNFVNSGATVGSADGSVVLISDGYYNQTWRYLSGTGQLEELMASRPLMYGAATNRRGTLFVTNTPAVLDASLGVIGSLPIANGDVTIATEAPLVYFSQPGTTVRVFDASAPVVGGQIAEVLPAITLVADPTDGNGAPKLRLSPDGRTLFAAGRNRMVVQPLQ